DCCKLDASKRNPWLLKTDGKLAKGHPRMPPASKPGLTRADNYRSTVNLRRTQMLSPTAATPVARHRTSFHPREAKRFSSILYPYITQLSECTMRRTASVDCSVAH